MQEQKEVRRRRHSTKRVWCLEQQSVAQLECVNGEIHVCRGERTHDGRHRRLVTEEPQRRELLGVGTLGRSGDVHVIVCVCACYANQGGMSKRQSRNDLLYAGLQQSDHSERVSIRCRGCNCMLTRSCPRDLLQHDLHRVADVHQARVSSATQ